MLVDLCAVKRDPPVLVGSSQANQKEVWYSGISFTRLSEMQTS